MEYRLNVYPIYLENGKEQWCVEYPELPGCVGGGDTIEEAIDDAKKSKKVYLDYLMENNLDIPKPIIVKNELPSGKIALRVSRTMHKKLLMLAENDGVSLNAYINSAISEKIGKSDLYNIFEETFYNFKKEFLINSEIKNENNSLFLKSVFSDYKK